MLEIRLLFRAIHILAAAAWVGGSIFYLVVVLPSLRLNRSAPEVAGHIAEGFRRLVQICIGALLLSGGYLVFDRLAQTTLGPSYLLVLVVKIVTAIIMFILALYLAQSRIRRLAKRSTPLAKVAPQLLLVLGILVFVLGALLNTLFEATIAPH